MWHESVWDAFQIGFWHPCGAYTGRSAKEVIEWKRNETERNGWTFWSFAYSPTANLWLRLLENARGPVFALCSYSPGARDPDKHHGKLRATHYRCFDESGWHPMPDPKLMYVTNPFKRRGLALAFKVRRVIALDPATPTFRIEWFAKRDRRWRSDKLPTRGEFLIRRGGSASLRPISALLELIPPYLTVLTCDRRDAHAA
jgi:hypothetical protein